MNLKIFKSKLFFLFALVVGAIFLINLIEFVKAPFEKVVKAPFEKVPKPTNRSSIAKTLFNNNELEKIVTGEIKDTDATFAIAIKNLKTGESYYFNEKEELSAASIYKLWVMAKLMEDIKKGSISKEELLSSDITVLNEKFGIAAEEAELKEGDIEMTVSDGLREMITISHNYAALLLSDRIKLSRVQIFLVENGFKNSSIGRPPRTTAFDTALFFEKLYNKELVGVEESNEMTELLKQQKLNNKLPKYLPTDIAIAHKTGELDEVTHDAGIVFGKKSDYIIVILSKSDDPKKAEEAIANVSKKIYNYFEN